MNRIKDRLIAYKISYFRLGVFGIGALLVTLGCYSMSVSLGAAYTFLGGFLFLTGLQVVTWSVGLHLELLGNVPAEYQYALAEVDVRDGQAAEYYDTSRERAAEYYSQAAARAADLYTEASEKVGEVAWTARETATRQTSVVAAAIEAGKKAYQEEKRKTELSGRIEESPRYKEEKTN